MKIKISETKNIDKEQIIELYRANQWSSANKPVKLYNALMDSHLLMEKELDK